ncbi:Cyclic di-GMP phosphodiesterase response regulator RpfG [Pseudobythopirellula maris]|uniref:Cyclic di-GMP phosphodiesterase response regulator RpfG n=1 Tax=Pseudobythopirellula maris TaxID=2527991 RepID=A0A5C5ZRG6_9BACT|nr:HD domain-containing phosphohydrolase [Pseudobythopirellula maris]TWT89890.1 Cyclic di-GMP phosphodiesterase response regulator RpfG [Pseudobythopirellula maris]
MSTMTPSAADTCAVPLPPTPTIEEAVEPSPGMPVSDAQCQPSEESLLGSRLMIVDDEPVNVKVVRRLLELEGYVNFVTTNQAENAEKMVEHEKPDLLLLDLMMPGVSGLEILDRLGRADKLRETPVIILTAVSDRETRKQALEAGAADFLNKPIDPTELAPRIKNVLRSKAYQDRLASYSRNLEEAVASRTAELQHAQREVAHCLARASEYRDNDTGFHVLRVGRYARLIGEALGMNPHDADQLEQAAQLHDVGKIGIGDDVLLKPGKLTEEEFAFMKKHCNFGKRILQQCTIEEEGMMREHSSIGAKILSGATSPLLAMARRIALTHHEWWDGSGYPVGLAGEDIPMEGRITAVADVFDALSSRRCYKEAFPLERCFAILREESGTHFDPRVIDAFFSRRDEIVAVQLEYADEN